MTKRLFTLFLIALLTISCVSVSAYAKEDDVNTTYFANGDYMVVTITESMTRASGTKSGTATYTYYNSNKVIQWQAFLHGTFSYNGTSATCTSASCDVSISNNNCYVVSKEVSKSANTASVNLVMGYRFLGITIRKDPYLITLSCDKDGKLS